MVGVLGALTTFSTLALETSLMLEQGSFGRALLNIGANNLSGLLTLWLGLALARSLPLPG